ncbi:MAG TPA: hypothetical protein VE619_06305 [Nitrososphaeraceae archaeon]|nr:hypothetical protein [Nitrososphaeraceae archaeon]
MFAYYCTNVALAAGHYVVAETKPILPILADATYNAHYSSDCTGGINNGQNKTYKVTNIRAVGG